MANAQRKETAMTSDGFFSEELSQHDPELFHGD